MVDEEKGGDMKGHVVDNAMGVWEEEAVVDKENNSLSLRSSHYRSIRINRNDSMFIVNDTRMYNSDSNR